MVEQAKTCVQEKDSGMHTEALESLSSKFCKEHVALAATASEVITLTLNNIHAEGWEVIVPNHGCHSIAAAVIRAGGIPVMVDVGSVLILTASLVQRALSKKTRAIIAVDQYGLPVDYTSIRSILPEEVILIADLSQSWDSKLAEIDSGVGAGVVVISLGPGKPLSLGAGGAAFSEFPITGIENGELSDRYSETILSAARFPMPLLHDLPGAIKRANLAVRDRRSLVDSLGQLYGNGKLQLIIPHDDSLPSWTRVPFRVIERDYNAESLNEYGRLHFIHNVPVSELEMVKCHPHRRVFSPDESDEEVLLLKLHLEI